MQRKRKNQQHPKSHAVRIPTNIFDLIKNSASLNGRTMVSEISFIVNDYFKSINANNSKPKNDFLKLSGLVKDLPTNNYSETIDDVLYGDSF